MIEIYKKIREIVTEDDLRNLTAFENFLYQNKIEFDKKVFAINRVYKQFRLRNEMWNNYKDYNDLLNKHVEMVNATKEKLLDENFSVADINEIEKNIEESQILFEEKEEFVCRIEDILHGSFSLDYYILSNFEIQEYNDIVDDYFELKLDIQYLLLIINYCKRLMNKDEELQLFKDINSYIESMLSILDNLSPITDQFRQFQEEYEEESLDIDNVYEKNSIQEEVIKVIAKLKNFVKFIKVLSNDESIKNLQNVKISRFLDIFGCDLDTYIRAVFALLERSLPALDICYFILDNKKSNVDKKYFYELAGLRENIINLVKKMSSSVQYNLEECEASRIKWQFESSHEKSKELEFLFILNSIADDNLEAFMNSKEKMKMLFDHVSEEQIEEAFKGICNKIQRKVSSENKFKEIKNKLLPIVKYLSISDVSFIDALATGEYLFNYFMVDSQDIPNFDYSFISIMYYTALESLLNSAIYTPYARKIKNIEAIKKFPDVLNYLSENPKGKSLSEPQLFFHKNYKDGKLILQDTVELGKLGNLLSRVRNIKNLKKFLQEDEYTITDNQIEVLARLGKDICTCADLRNKAAHGKERLSVEDARYDKSLVYNLVEAKKAKGYINEVLQSLL